MSRSDRWVVKKITDSSLFTHPGLTLERANQLSRLSQLVSGLDEQPRALLFI